MTSKNKTNTTNKHTHQTSPTFSTGLFSQLWSGRRISPKLIRFSSKHYRPEQSGNVSNFTLHCRVPQKHTPQLQTDGFLSFKRYSGM